MRFNPLDTPRILMSRACSGPGLKKLNRSRAHSTSRVFTFSQATSCSWVRSRSIATYTSFRGPNSTRTH